VGEGIRRSQDLDQWASFHDSFVALEDLIHRVGAGEKSTPPATITLLSVDVHHGYSAEAAFPDGDGYEESRIYQAVCSPPCATPFCGKESRLQDVVWTRPVTFAGRLLSLGSQGSRKGR
jgi:hypothetical protein